jgi:CspA family cold shock protein
LRRGTFANAASARVAELEPWLAALIRAKRANAANAPRYRSFPAKTDHGLSYQASANRRILYAEQAGLVRASAVHDLICPRRRRRMAKGTVKWFNPTKGYGFIQPSTGGKDVFVHISAVQKAGLSTLNEGQTIEYEEIANRGKTSAENLKV